MDIFFISFKETNCETNWKRLKDLHPEAKRIHGVVGIDKVHLICDTLSSTEFFWTIDGDNYITKSLHYDAPIESDLVMFKAIDPIQKSLTLLGGAKIWRKGSIINRDMSKGDFSLNATKSKEVVDKEYSFTLYNASRYDAWKTSFRHCVKLMSVIFKSRPNAKNIDAYIEHWRSTKSSNEKNADWAYQGFVDAENYVKLYDNNLEELHKINDYNWLENYFREKYGTP